MVETATSAWLDGTSMAGIPFGKGELELFPKNGFTVADKYPLYMGAAGEESTGRLVVAASTR